jgi:outer membrane protein TolC
MEHWAKNSLRIIVILCLPILANGQVSQVKPPSISLDEAIHRAEQNEPIFASTVAAQKSAGIDQYLAKAALLPSVIYHNQVLYTQPNGQIAVAGQAGSQSPIFIANNAIHEYTSQASINETIGLKGIADARIASANAARASAELEIARRGLVSAVVNLYYLVSASVLKQQLYKEGLDEAQAFTSLTEKKEVAREVAHADVVKAQLQSQQRQRDLSDAVLAATKAQMELGVLLFPDPRTPYSTESLTNLPVLPGWDDVSKMASSNNPEIASAFADLKASDASVISAKAGYLPDLGLNFSYGIDAPQFAKNGRDGTRNLGYSITGTLDIPVWDWFSTQKRIRQSEIQRDAARVRLTAAQRRLIAALETAYAEAAAAHNQLDLLDQSVRTASESLRLTKLRYSAGESTALEVVDAQNAYLSAGTAQADGFVRYETALAILQTLTGKL